MHAVFFHDLICSEVGQKSLHIEEIARLSVPDPRPGDPPEAPSNVVTITVHYSNVTGEYYVIRRSGGNEEDNQWQTFHNEGEAFRWALALLTELMGRHW